MNVSKLGGGVGGLASVDSEGSGRLVIYRKQLDKIYKDKQRILERTDYLSKRASQEVVIQE